MTNYSKNFRICIALDEYQSDISPITLRLSRYDLSAEGDLGGATSNASHWYDDIL